MYQSYWQLESDPFPYRADVGQLYQARTTQSASLRLRYCFANNAGAALLLGQSGAGKSALLQQLKATEPKLRPFVHVPFAVPNPQDVLATIALELLGDKATTLDTTVQSLNGIRDAIRDQTPEQGHAVIVLDEAHLLTNDTLNQVVLPLLNYAVSDSELDYSLVLAGHPVLASHIARNAQLRERISVTASLDCFTQNETSDYISTRLVEAGATREIFTAEAVDAVFRLSSGNPRRINRLCDMSLLVGYADQQESISAAQVESLATEFLPAAA